MDDDNPRPQKRPRLVSSPLTSTPTRQISTQTETFTPLPTATLLLALPGLLIHPPTHKYHPRGLSLTRSTLHACLAQPGVESDVECRAWTGLAEIGLIALGLEEHAREGWEGGLAEVEKAITKGLLIAQKHPSLRLYRCHLTILSAYLAHHHAHNPKFAQSTLRRLTSSFLLSSAPNSDPPHVVYAAHLALIASYEAETLCSSSLSASHSPARALAAVAVLHELATKHSHMTVARLALVIKVQVLINHGSWTGVGDALRDADKALGVEVLLGDLTSTSTKDTPKPSRTQDEPADENQTTSKKRTNAEMNADDTPTCLQSSGAVGTDQEPPHPALFLPLLMYGVIYHTHAGSATAANARLKVLYARLDEGALNVLGEKGDMEVGVWEIRFPPSPVPLYLKTTHPRILYVLAYLLTACAKRDVVGRRPKRILFAREGLSVLAKEEGKEVALLPYASMQDLREVQQGMERLKSDLMCETIGAYIMRSEFDDATRTLAQLTAHTRTHALFPSFAARIVLLHAQLAHGLGSTDRALKCYRVAAWVAGGEGRAMSTARSATAHVEVNREQEEYPCTGKADPWVRAAARAGEVWIRIGMFRRGRRRSDGPVEVCVDVDMEADSERPRNWGKEQEGELQEIKALAEDVTKECDGLGSTLQAIAEVLRACLTDEFLGAKQHLRHALELATRAEDNHLRALVLALVASHYVHTAREQAEEMLMTCEQLAAGLGAQAKGRGKDKGAGAGGGAVGNARLRLWVGERFLELYRWSGEDEKARRQVQVNEQLEEAVRRVEVKGRGM